VRSPQPPLEYLAKCSQSSLEGFQLARLDQIAKLRDEIAEIQEEWVQAEVAARLARLLLEGHRAGSHFPGDSPALAPSVCSLLPTSLSPTSSPQLATISASRLDVARRPAPKRRDDAALCQAGPESTPALPAASRLAPAVRTPRRPNAVAANASARSEQIPQRSSPGSNRQLHLFVAGSSSTPSGAFDSTHNGTVCSAAGAAARIWLSEQGWLFPVPESRAPRRRHRRSAANERGSAVPLDACASSLPVGAPPQAKDAERCECPHGAKRARPQKSLRVSKSHVADPFHRSAPVPVARPRNPLTAFRMPLLICLSKPLDRGSSSRSISAGTADSREASSLLQAAINSTRHGRRFASRISRDFRSADRPSLERTRRPRASLEFADSRDLSSFRYRASTSCNSLN
jgi:hypothetical protein